MQRGCIFEDFWLVCVRVPENCSKRTDARTVNWGRHMQRGEIMKDDLTWCGQNVKTC